MRCRTVTELSAGLASRAMRLACRFDDSGNPTHDADGAQLAPKAAKKAVKDAEALRKPRQQLVKKLRDDPQFLDKLKQDVASLRQALQQAGCPLPADVAKLREEVL